MGVKLLARETKAFDSDEFLHRCHYDKFIHYCSFMSSADIEFVELFFALDDLTH